MKFGEMEHRHTIAGFTCSPEFELLLCSARTAPDECRMTALIDTGIDWHAFLDLCTQHRVRLLVYRALQSVCWNKLSSEMQTEWRGRYQQLTGRNLFITGELLRVNAAFKAEGIFLVAMKGPVIAQMAYGDFALREFADLDLLVREQDFGRAVDLLERLAFHRSWKYDHQKTVSFLRHMGEFTLSSDTLQTEIDLHWRVAHKSVALSPAIGDFPEGFRPVALAGSTVLTFAPQDLPLYLAAQGGADQWSDLRRICDLAEFLRAYPAIEWEQHLETARRLGGLRSMLTGLALASDLLGTELPSSIVSQIQQDPVVSQLARGAIRNLQNNVESTEATSRYLFQLRAKQSLRGKIALAYSILMDRTAKDGSWIMLPRPLWWLYGLLRPLRMSRKLIHRE
jgi:hypothetical protein